MKYAAAAASTALAMPMRAQTGKAMAEQPVVIASGVSTMPPGQVTWNVIHDDAQPAGEADAIARALGFAVATSDPLLVVDETNGTEVQLSAGEAAFVPDSAVQRRVSLDDRPHSYLRIDLVSPEDADFAAGCDPIDANERFEAPAGRRVVELRSGQLRPDHAVMLAATEAPTLLVAIDGDFVVETDGETVHLRTGEAIASGAALLIVGAGTNGGRFVVAQIGEEIATSDAEPAGAIQLQVFACPPEMSSSDLPQTQDACEIAIDALEFAVLQGPILEWTKDDLQRTQNAWSWKYLAFGYYELILDNSVRVMSTNDATSLGEPYGNTACFWPITLGPDKPTVALQVYATAE
jgi:hypothetical protein